MASRPVRLTRSLALVLAGAGCDAGTSAERTAALQAIAGLDPVMGAAADLERAVLGMPDLVWNTAGEERAEFLAARCATRAVSVDELSNAFAAAELPDLLALRDYLGSEDGIALHATTTLLLAGLLVRDAEGSDRSLERLSEANRVGPGAKQRLEELVAEPDRSRWPTPDELGLLVAAAGFAPRHATALRTFLSTDAGTLWREARGRLASRTHRVLLELREAADTAGLCEDQRVLDARLPNYLPSGK